MDMQFYCLCNCVRQKQFYVHWKRAAQNLADYVMKHHATKHHVQVRPKYVSNAVQVRNQDTLHKIHVNISLRNLKFRKLKLQVYVNCPLAGTVKERLQDQFKQLTKTKK